MTIPYNIGNAPFEDYFIRKELFSTGGLWGWGRGVSGELGTNDGINKSSPVQTVAGGTNWKSVSGGGYSNAAIKTDGTLWTWGADWYGQLGDVGNDGNARYGPDSIIGTNWKLVNSGAYQVAAIKTDGTLWLWGRNVKGELGNNTISDGYFTPVQTIAGGTNWKSITGSVGWHDGNFFIAMKTDGSIWSWGNNSNGQLCTNDQIARSSPVQINTELDWKSIGCGGYHAVAIKTDGTLWGWGYNGGGELGTNDNVGKSSPVQTIAGGTNWKSVSCGMYHTAAIKTDGTLWSWGYNKYGQLGTNDNVGKSSPVQTIAGGTNWKLVSCGMYHTAAIKTDGTLWTWGYNAYGQLGTNDIIHRSSPVQTIAGGTNWKSVSCGGYYTVAIADDS